MSRGRGPGRVSVGMFIVTRRNTEVREQQSPTTLESLGGVVSTAEYAATLESVMILCRKEVKHVGGGLGEPVPKERVGV